MTQHFVSLLSSFDNVCYRGLPRTMNVSLTSTLETLVHRLVESGRYKSASEVVRDGLRLLEERESFREIKLTELRRLVREGQESGLGVPWDLEDFQSRARERRREGSSD